MCSSQHKDAYCSYSSHLRGQVYFSSSFHQKLHYFNVLPQACPSQRSQTSLVSTAIKSNGRLHVTRDTDEMSYEMVSMISLYCEITWLIFMVTTSSVALISAPWFNSLLVDSIFLAITAIWSGVLPSCKRVTRMTTAFRLRDSQCDKV